VKVVKVARLNPVAYTPYFLAFLLGAAVGKNIGIWLIPASLAILFTGMSGHTLNFIADARSGVDRIAKRKEIDLRGNPILTGEVSEQIGYAFAVSSLLMGIILAWLAGWFFFLCTIVAAFFAVVGYNFFYWKAKPFLDILCIPVCAGTLIFIAGAGKICTEALVYTLLTAGAYLETEVFDIQEDKACGIRNTAVVLGKEKSYYVYASLYIIGLIAGVILFALSRSVFYAVFAVASLIMITGISPGVRREKFLLRLKLITFLFVGLIIFYIV
jgi:4-hydroxybenzoate polyprenyltransferase